MKKVLFFLPPSTGGAEKITTTIAHMLDKEQFNVAYVIIGRRRGDVVNYIQDNSRIIYIPTFSMKGFVWQKLWLLLKKEQPDCVFSSITPINCHLIHAANKIGNVKVLVRCNCAVDRIQGYNLKLAKCFYPKADLVIAQTNSMRNDLISAFNLLPNQVITLNNPIDKEQLLVKSSEENPYGSELCKKFVWVGRFNEIKQVDVLIKAFSIVHKIIDQSKLYLVGKKDDANGYYRIIVKLVEDFGLKYNVIFTGFQTNPYKWIKNADCLVLTSKSEASPNVVFESLYLGTPVVVSNCTPDLDFIITDGNGFVVPIGDIDNTAEAMRRSIFLHNVKLNRNCVSEEEINKLFSILVL